MIEHEGLGAANGRNLRRRLRSDPVGHRRKSEGPEAGPGQGRRRQSVQRQLRCVRSSASRRRDPCIDIGRSQYLRNPSEDRLAHSLGEPVGEPRPGSTNLGIVFIALHNPARAHAHHGHATTLTAGPKIIAVMPDFARVALVAQKTAKNAPHRDHPSDVGSASRFEPGRLRWIFRNECDLRLDSLNLLNGIPAAVSLCHRSFASFAV